MKIFTHVEEEKDKSLVGLVLVGDHNKIYQQVQFDINANKFEASMIGIKRALLFVDNNKPLHCNDNIMIYSNLNNYNDNLNLENRVLRDEYINKFKCKHNQSIELNYKPVKDENKEFMNIAQVLVNVHKRQQYALSLSNKGNSK